MSDAAVIDPSVALLWLWGSAGDAARAEALLRTTAMARLPVLVGPAFHARVAAALHQASSARGQGRLTSAEAVEALSAVVLFPFQTVAEPSLCVTGLRLAQQFPGLTADQGADLALASMMGCELWTADEALLTVLAGALPHVRPLAAYGG